jgi:hypothetical protein
MATYLKHPLDDSTGRIQLHVTRKETLNVRLPQSNAYAAQIAAGNLQR